MKKLIIFIPILLVTLSGCSLLKNLSNTKNSISTGIQITYPKQENLGLDIIKRQKQFESLVDLPVVTSQKIERTLVLGDKSKGRISTHDYPELGIKIYSDDPYSESFKQEPPFIMKNGDTLVDPFSPGQYIRVIAKNPNETIQQIFDKEYISQVESGCKLEKITRNILTGNVSSIEYYMLTNKEGSCFVGGNGVHQRSLSFFYNINKPDRYYLYNYVIGCAPGKCNVFNQIELY